MATAVVDRSWVPLRMAKLHWWVPPPSYLATSPLSLPLSGKEGPLPSSMASSPL
jgi:hypothetical protein